MHYSYHVCPSYIIIMSSDAEENELSIIFTRGKVSFSIKNVTQEQTKLISPPSSHIFFVYSMQIHHFDSKVKFLLLFCKKRRCQV